MFIAEETMKIRASLSGKRGVDMLHDPTFNKGTAFTEAEREVLGLRGLLPPHVHTQADQIGRVLENVRHKGSDLEKYLYMVSLQDRNETLFYRVLVDNLDELMPIVYTPTVGQACQRYAHVFRRPRGLFISLHDRGRVRELLRNWPNREVRVVVVTDGERILGLGDLGANGMGIPVGKLALYSACAGIHPLWCLPILLDVGTNNGSLLSDPLYFGLHKQRERGPAYDDLVDELVVALEERFPGLLIQLEDFGTANAFRLLRRYRDRSCVFDDDIQGTAAVALAGFLAASRLTGRLLHEERLLFLGAGEAGVGISDLVVAEMIEEGMAPEHARQSCWLFDSKGLVQSGRTDLAEHKLAYAHTHPPITDLATAVRELRPTALIGVSGQPGTFTEQVVRALARQCDRPIIFALSNPTSKAECTAEQAYLWSEGRAVFASGSPFPPVTYEGRTFVPGQGNNSYIFPGVGLGVLASEARHVTDEMFLASAHTLAAQVTDEDLSLGRIYPALSRIRLASIAIAAAVAQVAYARGLAGHPRPSDLVEEVRSIVFDPDYVDYA
jgi:malate dehydrogenase (oxaloacetate-decarboxylating)(NADP+)